MWVEQKPTNSCREAEKSKLTHGMCWVGEQGERERQEGWAEGQRGGGCDSESHSNPWSRAGARETCSHDERRWRRNGRVGGCRKMTSTGLGVSPSRGGSAGVWVNGA